MSERFLKFIPSKEALYLLTKKGHAFRLLAIVAELARRYEGGVDGLKVGEALIGGHENYDMSEQNYRTAKDILVRRQHLKIVETCRTRKKVTTGITTVGTKVKLLSSSVWDINSDTGNDRSNDRPTTDQRPTNDELRMIKKEKKDHHPYPSASGLTDDFSSKEEKVKVCDGVFMRKKDLDLCIQLKGSLEKVQEGIAFILGSKKRKCDITDWPNALANWKVENKVKVNIRENANLAEKLCRQFEEFENGNGWRIRLYTDQNRDQKGILFESESAYHESVFVALVDGEFKQKCRDLIEKNIVGEK